MGVSSRWASAVAKTCGRGGCGFAVGHSRLDLAGQRVEIGGGIQ